MTFRFNEARDSRALTHNPPSYELKFHAAGSDSELFIHGHALNATPQIVSTPGGTLYRADVRVEWVGYEIAEVTIPYASRESQAGSYSLSFDTTGATTNIRFSKQTMAAYGDAQINDFGQLIGVNDDQVEGTDIIIPALKITAHFRHPQGIITLPQIKVLANITGTVNSAPMLTFAAGEVLFLGASGSEGSDADTEIAYNFAMSANATGMSIGEIAAIAKRGWDAIWVRWRAEEVRGFPARKPQGVYTERVYNEVNHAAILGFG